MRLYKRELLSLDARKIPRNPSTKLNISIWLREPITCSFFSGSRVDNSDWATPDRGNTTVDGVQATFMQRVELLELQWRWRRFGFGSDWSTKLSVRFWPMGGLWTGS